MTPKDARPELPRVECGWYDDLTPAERQLHSQRISHDEYERRNERRMFWWLVIHRPLSAWPYLMARVFQAHDRRRRIRKLERQVEAERGS